MKAKKKMRPLSAKKRQSIVDQAARLFLKNGFGATSMDEVSGAADVSKRTLYNHFPTKRMLFAEIVKLEWQKVSYRKFHKPHIHKPEDIFTAIMEHVLKTMYSARMQNLLRLVIAESAKFPELRTLQAKYGLEPLIEDFAAYVDFLNKKGVLDVDNPKIAVAQYIGLVKECLYWPWLLGVVPKPSEKHQKEIIKRANEIFFTYYRAR